ncbi:MAG: class II aldolase/adducin family protein [Thermodesulfobacteriota bacterium]|nr:class II aldolase/adducin family protein [Thermodesulfobacteriota bacterium]
MDTGCSARRCINSIKEEFCQFCHLLYSRRLVTGVGGNMAARVGDKILLTPSGHSLRLVEKDVVVTVNGKGIVLEGGEATREAGMHLGILDARPDVNVVCHIHGAYIIAATAMLAPGPASLPPLTPGFIHYVHPLPMIPFMIPGTEALAETVAREFEGGRPCALLLQNHGLITVGKDFQEAFNVAEEVDETARIYVLTYGRAKGIPPE